MSRQAKNYDKHTFDPGFKIGDHIMVNIPYNAASNVCSKFYRPWKGPYKIVEVNNPVIKIDAGDNGKWVHMNRCKKSYTSERPTIQDYKNGECANDTKNIDSDTEKEEYDNEPTGTNDASGTKRATRNQLSVSQRWPGIFDDAEECGDDPNWRPDTP
ncbi:hypothetical protein RF11_08990 [Thelohanellus kitauei]|uniref:Uncharacterized protein n=1 Tax=Thelohanellus kitauei TaxID=669202 RepID=A0A0C2IBV6_THEKT|nr:hypothetical protein RF11_08990 [Thelohanellus kitauei]